MALDRLARLGASLKGGPQGIDDRALAMLLEHEWTANELEFRDVMLRAALVSRGRRMTADDLLASGFSSQADRQDETGRSIPSAPPASRRPRTKA